MAAGDHWTHGTGKRAPYILSALFACADLLLLWSTVEVARTGLGPWAYCVPPVLMAALWPFLHWERGAGAGRRALSVVFLLTALIGLGIGNGLTGLPLMAVTIVHAVCVFGFGGGVTLSALMTATAIWAHLLAGRELARAVTEAVVVGVFAGWALLTARILLGARRRASETERLLGELTEAHAELRRYAARVRELTVAEERARMSREMHDSVGHYLTVMNLGLENARRFRQTRPDEAWEEVAQVQRLTMEALADTRRWVRALKPLALEGRAGPAAMEELARSFGGTGIEVAFRAHGTRFALAEEAELALYRVLQEGLTNAVRHSGARRVEVVLRADGDQVVLTVTDDGRGADGDALEAGRGLAGLRHRVLALGGRLSAESGPAGGFTLRAEVPVKVEVDA